MAYDEVGNQTQVNPYTLSYDAENRVAGSTSASNGSVAYAYDGEGSRVKKTVNGTLVTAFVYNAFGQLIAEYGAGTGETGLRYMTTDHLGSVRLVTGSTGNVIRRHDYRPFGQDLSGNGRSTKYSNLKNVVRFTGKERDDETGLDYFGGPEEDPITKTESVMTRYFSSAQGRFTSPDRPMLDQNPLFPQSWNLFSFVRNNPLTFFDPSGGKCKRNPDGSFEGDCSSPGDEKVTEGDKPQVANVNDKQGSVLDLLMASGVPRYVPNDRPLEENARKVITVAYYRTAHDLGCAGMGFAVGDAGGALFVSGQPNAGFRSPVSGKLVGGSKPFASGGASAGSSTLSGALRDALPQRLPGQVPTPVGGPGTGRAFGMQGSNRLGVVLGRWAPFVGVAGMAYGAYSMNACLSQ